jgi:hypothetical protein
LVAANAASRASWSSTMIFSFSAILAWRSFIKTVADDTTKRRAFEIGVDDYVMKPFDPDDFVTRVGRQIRQND